MNKSLFRKEVDKLISIGEIKHVIDSLFIRYPEYINVFKDNLKSLLFDRPSKTNPLVLYWCLTYRCNCRCPFCYQKGHEKKELEAKYLKDIAEQVVNSNIYGVGFTGGEPLLHESLLYLVKLLKKKRKFVYIETNGILLEEFSRDFVDLEVDWIVVSIDSHIPSLHDDLRKSKGLWEKALKGISAIISKRKNKLPFITIRMVVMKDNYKYLEQYIELFKGKVDSITLQPYMPSSGVGSNANEFLLNKGDIYNFQCILNRLSKNYSFLDNQYYKLMPEFMLSPFKLIEERLFRCIWNPTFRMEMDVNGDIYPCLSARAYDKNGNSKHLNPVGNAKQDTLIDIWRSREWFLLQRYLRSEESNCVCWCFKSAYSANLLKAFNLSRGSSV